METAAMNPPDSQDSLSRTLHAWRVKPARDPRFRAAVWSRVEGARSAQPWGSYARAHAGAVAGALVLAVALGGVIGREQARARVAAESTQLATAYVQGLDARNMRMP